MSEAIPKTKQHLSLVTASPAATMELGRRIGERLSRSSIVALTGELGCGKTCFAKGLCSGLGIPRRCVNSPTFTLVNEYTGRFPVLHLDLYRVENARAGLEVGILDYLARAQAGVAIIEWADRVLPLLPDKYLAVQFAIISGRKRQITLTAVGARYRRFIDEVSNP